MLAVLAAPKTFAGADGYSVHIAGTRGRSRALSFNTRPRKISPSLAGTKERLIYLAGVQRSRSGVHGRPWEFIGDC